MRYRDGEQLDPEYPYTEGMHTMITVSAVLSVLIGAILLWLSLKGRVMWLTAWSGGLIVASLVYLIGDFVGYF